MSADSVDCIKNWRNRGNEETQSPGKIISLAESQVQAMPRNKVTWHLWGARQAREAEQNDGGENRRWGQERDRISHEGHREGFRLSLWSRRESTGDSEPREGKRITREPG